MADSSNNAWHQPTIRPSDHIKERFGQILNTINIPAIGRFASTVRQSGHRSTSSHDSYTGNKQQSLIPCKILEKPMSGTFNIVFELEFADGAIWMLKVPANGFGDRFNAISRRAFVSEARTMQMIKNETTISIPAVYAFDDSTDNELGVAFMMMEKIKGRPLYGGWWNRDIPKTQLERFRARVLQDVAAAMVQLNKYSFDRSGSLMFNKDGKPVGVEESKSNDGIFWWDGLEEHNPGDGELWSPKGPFTNPKAYYRETLDRLANGIPEFDCPPDLQGGYKSLNLFIDWACEKLDIKGNRFVLAHPDLDLQNILVHEDGTLGGFIDWDCAAAVPREMGCGQVPEWLTRDWTSSEYNYDVEAGKTRDGCNEESSPDELTCYRAMYAQFMEVEIERMTGGRDKPTNFGTLPKEEAELTRRSLLMKKLNMAANYPNYSLEIVMHIHGLIEKLTADEWEEDPSTASSSSRHSENEKSDHETQPSEVENDSLDGNILDDPDPLAKNDTNKIQPLLSHTLAQVSEGLARNALNQQTPSEPSGPHCQDDANPGSNQASMVHTSETRSADSALPSRKVRMFQFCCGLCEKGLRLTAKALYQNNQGNEKSDTASDMELEHNTHTEDLLERLQKRFTQMLDRLHKETIHPAQMPDDHVSVIIDDGHSAFKKGPVAIVDAECSGGRDYEIGKI